jgi:4-amino-4-deoxy-L-arabinose transferase-like glycosyltransferase
VSRFVRVLLVILVVAFAIRVAYVGIAKAGPCRGTIAGRVVTIARTKCLEGDEIFYSAEADYVAQGHGFNDPLAQFRNPGQKAPPAADHPPLTVLVLTPVSWFLDHPPLSWMIHDPFDTHAREHRDTMVVLGTILVGLIGLLGRRVGGDTVGLVAAAIAAVSPNMWVNDGLVMSETITSLAVVGALFCALQLYERPSWGRAIALGVVCGLAGLARVEFLLLVPLLGVVVALASQRSWGSRIGLAGVVVAATLVVLAPWVTFNLTRFHDPAFVSTNDGLTLAGANCPDVYYGSYTGLWALSQCTGTTTPTGDQSQASSAYRKQAFDYIRAHRSRVPVVMLARVGRVWSVFRPGDMIQYNAGEDREPWVTRLGLIAYYPTMIAAIGGAVVLWRRRARMVLWVLTAPIVVVTVNAMVTYGQTRFRAPAEPSLALLAAFGGVALVRALRDRPARSLATT